MPWILPRWGKCWTFSSSTFPQTANLSWWEDGKERRMFGSWCGGDSRARASRSSLTQPSDVFIWCPHTLRSAEGHWPEISAICSGEMEYPRCASSSLGKWGTWKGQLRMETENRRWNELCSFCLTTTQHEVIAFFLYPLYPHFPLSPYFP